MTMLAAALGYAELGWPVFPCAPPDNTPFTKHGFQDASLEPDQIRSWWDRHPAANIAIRTGVACDVLDIDHTDFATGVTGLPDFTCPGPIARSGGNKFHLYYAPSGLGRRIRFSEHCDWLGSDGYVVAPPSTHRTGGTYRWITWTGRPLAPAPAVLVDTVRIARQPKPPPPQSTVTPTSLATLTTSGWSASGLIATMATAAEGERNAVLNWCALRVGNGVYDGKITFDQAQPVLEDLKAVALRAGLDDRETVLTIKSGYTAGGQGIR